MNKLLGLTILFFISIPVFLSAQNKEEDGVIIIKELPHPSGIKKRIHQSTQISEKTTSEPRTLTLPFIDNFTRVKFDNYENLNEPDTNNWFICDNVRLLRTTAINPPDYGTACFDGLKGDGYPHIVDPGPQYGYGDSLLSHYIDTSELEERKDSLTLSFYVERGGLAYQSPGPDDTLFVEIRQSDETTGRFQRLDFFTINNTQSERFRFVNIPLKTKEYFHKKLQIKFKTIGALNGAFDLWHIDYIYLQKNRPENDSAVFDLAIVAAKKNFLTPYTAIPVSYLDTNIVTLNPDTNLVSYRNYGSDGSFSKIGTTIQEVIGAQKIFIGAPESKNTEFPPQTIFDAYSGNITPKNYYKDIENKENWLIKFTNEIASAEGDLTNRNDTMVQYIHADSILALDDGEFEMSLGVKTPKAMGQRFEILKDDTLRALWLNFQPREALNDTFIPVKFRLGIWLDSLSSLIPIYINSETEYIVNTVPDWDISCANINPYHRKICAKFRGPNQMVRYPFERPVPIKKGAIIAGMIQLQKATGGDGGGLLGLGLDRNYDNGDNLFYQKDITWEKIGVKGTFAIRLELSGPLGNGLASRNEIPKKSTFLVYPNPNSERNFKVSLPESKGNILINIYDVTGRNIFKKHIFNEGMLFNIELDPATFSGVYILEIIDSKGDISRAKLLLN